MKSTIIVSFSLIAISIIFSCKTADKVISVDNSKEEAVEDSPLKEEIPSNDFESKMDNKVPVQSISVDKNRVRGTNQARPR